MRHSRNNRIISILKRSIPPLALILALAPSSARAGAIQALRLTMENSFDATVAQKVPATPTPSKESPKPVAKPDSKDSSLPPEKPVTVGLNSNGDMAIKRGDLSVTMGYCAPEDTFEPAEKTGRVQVAQQFQKDPPSINGFNLKLNFVF